MSSDSSQYNNTAQDVKPFGSAPAGGGQAGHNAVRNVCANCGAELYGKYCYNCGQKAIERNDRTVGTYIRNFFEESFSFDSRFFQSLKLLYTKPGFLTLEYVSGRVNRYVTPLKLYLFLSIAAFFIGSLISKDTLSGFKEDLDSDNAKAFIDSYIEKTGVPYAIFEERYNSQLEGKLPLYFMGLVVLFSLPLKLIYITHKRYYVEHLVFSIHFFCFILTLSVLSDLLELVIPGITEFFFFVLPFFYLLLSLKRVYGQTFILTFFETIILYIYYTVLLALTVIGAFLVTLFLV